MMADYSAVIAALILDHAADLAVGSPALPVFFHGVAVKPPVKPKYLYVQYFINPTSAVGIAHDSTLLHEGLLQIDVYWPNGTGIIDPMAAAGSVIDHFPRTLELWGSPLVVKFDRPAYASTPMQEGNYQKIVVTVPWRAFAT